MVFSPDMDSTEPELHAGRRGILVAAIWGIGAAISAVVASILGLASVAPLRRSGESQWIDAGPVNSLSSKPQRLAVAFMHRQGWSEEARTLVYYAYTDDKGQPVVFSSQCSHLGCSVRWADDRSSFECPCHGGKFDKSGAVLAGPPSEALTRPQVRVEDSRLQIEHS